VLPSQPEVVPVVAVQRGMSREHRNRFAAVRNHLAVMASRTPPSSRSSRSLSLVACSRRMEIDRSIGDEVACSEAEE
jgi:hypothetical protein